MKPLPLICLMWVPVLFLSAGEEPAPPPVHSVHDDEAIDRAMGETITVKGRVKEAFWVRGNVLLITFREEKEGFVAVSFKKHREALDAAFDGDVAAAVKGKDVAVTGEVEEYNYRPQIVIRDPEQLTVLETTQHAILP